jgi:hypothetical protein
VSHSPRGAMLGLHHLSKSRRKRPRWSPQQGWRLALPWEQPDQYVMAGLGRRSARRTERAWRKGIVWLVTAFDKLNSVDPAARAPQIQSSANTPIIKYLYPAKSLTL